MRVNSRIAPNHTVQYRAANRTAAGALVQRGYADARAGKPWAADYDLWGKADQVNYELGRQRAIECRAVHGDAPQWRANGVMRNALGRHGLIPETAWPETMRLMAYMRNSYRTA